MYTDPHHAFLASVEQRLAADGCAPHWDDWGGAPVLVGRRTDFRWGWMATKLHLFTVATAVPEITLPLVERFTQDAMAYAKQHRGSMVTDFRNGAAVLPVLVSPRVEPAAMAWAEQDQRSRMSCFARPVVVDTTHGYIGYFRGSAMMGLVYSDHLLRKAAQYFHPQSLHPQALDAPR
ncbi:levansucrase [Streptomyces sp. GSL17-111]|uniref:levansucrase n=1 Tax=Streptomyces sp. GSL17-111 TaxID=3121596 RepID=UPI0030F3A53F